MFGDKHSVFTGASQGSINPAVFQDGCSTGVYIKGCLVSGQALGMLFSPRFYPQGWAGEVKGRGFPGLLFVKRCHVGTKYLLAVLMHYVYVCPRERDLRVENMLWDQQAGRHCSQYWGAARESRGAAFGMNTSFCSTSGVLSYSDFSTVKMHLEVLVPLVLVCNSYLVLTVLMLRCDGRVIQGRPNPP